MTQKELKSIEELIERAIKKINGQSENDVCKYLPMNAGGYMHHFTLRKMKQKAPEALSDLIETNIIQANHPALVPHKPRRPRGSRKRNDLICLSRPELDRIIHHLRLAGEQDIASKFSPRRSLTQIKRQLTASIRRNLVETELWNAYAEAVSGEKQPPQDAPAFNDQIVVTS